jgi:hypothetical protein
MVKPGRKLLLEKEEHYTGTSNHASIIFWLLGGGRKLLLEKEEHYTSASNASGC